MMTATDRALIAASVDGRLADADEVRLRLLLDRSRDARRLQDSLKRDRDAIAELSNRKAPQTLLPTVMARIAEMDPFATIPSTRFIAPRRRLLPAAIAASVAILAGLGVWYGVQVNQRHVMVQAQSQALPNIEVSEPPVPELPPEVVSHDPPPEVSPLRVAVGPELAPAPRAIEDKPREVYGAPFVPLPKLDAVLVRLPMIVAVKDLGRDDVKKQLALELAKPAVVRVDLFSRDSLKAAELLVATGRAAGVNVILDAVAQERLRRRLPTTWLVYTESLTPEEAAAWLLRLAASDVKPAEGSGSKPVFQTLHIPASTQQDAKDLKDLLGIDPAKSKLAKASPAKPVSAGTLAEISNTLQKDKTAVLVSYLPQSARVAPGASKDVKAWLDRRGDRKPGTVALEIVVR